MDHDFHFMVWVGVFVEWYFDKRCDVLDDNTCVCMYVCAAVAVSDLKEEDPVDHLGEFVLTAGKVTSVAHGYCHLPYVCETKLAIVVVFWLDMLGVLSVQNQLVIIFWEFMMLSFVGGLLINFSFEHVLLEFETWVSISKDSSCHGDSFVQSVEEGCKAR